MTARKDQAITVSAVFAAAATLSAIISYTDKVRGMPVYLEVFLASLISVSLISSLVKKARMLQRGREVAEELSEGMRYVLSCSSKGIPMPLSLRLASSISSDDSVKMAFADASKRLRLGDTAAPAFTSLQALPQDVRRRIDSLDWSDTKSALESIVDDHTMQGEERRSKIEESIQRHATLNMFLSTILPSFIMFAFIGSMLISQRQESMLLVSLVLLIALPTAYAFGNMLLSRRLFG